MRCEPWPINRTEGDLARAAPDEQPPKILASRIVEAHAPRSPPKQRSFWQTSCGTRLSPGPFCQQMGPDPNSWVAKSCRVAILDGDFRSATLQ
jgi:hypothetical protein